MYRKIEDFINDWAYESESTLKLFNNLSDESLTKHTGSNLRTAGRLAWHITTSIGEIMHRTGLSFQTVNTDAPIPNTAKELIEEYKRASENLINQIKDKWNDDSLEQVDDMYGEQWKRGSTLAVLINHQIHHRGQLTIVMRLNDLKVPGVYGPSKEEWSQMGMPAQE
jgi:uncharacterized damage-inducible protein DinB